jgi:hypothetical protein
MAATIFQIPRKKYPQQTRLRRNPTVPNVIVRAFM